MDMQLEKKINVALIEESKARLVELGFLDKSHNVQFLPMSNGEDRKQFVAIGTEIIESSQTHSGYLASGTVLGVFSSLREAKSACDYHKDVLSPDDTSTLNWVLIDTDWTDEGIKLELYQASYYDGEFIIQAVDKSD